MKIKCPQCKSPFKLKDPDSDADITCPSCGSSFQPEENATVAWAPAQRLGKFQILKVVGQGAFGMVYQARDTELDRIVALKVPRAGSVSGKKETQQFIREARAVAKLRHPSIVSIHEVGVVDKVPYLVSDFVEGVTLADYLSGRRATFAQAAQLAAQLADALDYAHSHGVVHRDVKPSNVMVETEVASHGSTERSGSDRRGRATPVPCSITPRLMDFGLAKRDGGDATVTVEGQVMGTPSYMSPEQARGDSHEVDGRGDVYSLGVMLYQMLTAELPFRGTSRMILHQVLHDEPRSPRTLNDKVPRDLETICLKAMAKEPGRRYQTAGALADDLWRYLQNEPILARPFGRVERLRKWVKRRPAVAALLVVCAFSGVLVAAGISWHYFSMAGALYETERQREAAEANARESKRQREEAEGNYQKRVEVIENILIRVDERLANMNGVGQLRLELLLEALRLSQELLQDRPSDPVARKHTAIIQRSIGNLWQSEKNFKDGDQAYQKSIALWEALALEFPGDASYQEEMGMTIRRRGRLQQTYRQYAQAAESFRKAIEIQDALSAVSQNAAHRDDAARTRYELARLHETTGAMADAEAAYREALQRQQKLADENPTRAEFHVQLATIASGLAIFLNAKNIDESQSLLQQAVAACRQARRVNPQAPNIRRALDDNYAELAAFLRHHARHDALERMAGEYRLDMPDPGGSTYNVACFFANAVSAVDADRTLTPNLRSRARSAYAAQAIDYLAKAIKENYTERVHMDVDYDLDPLRELSEFQAIMKDLERRFPLSANRQLTLLNREYQSAEDNLDFLTRSVPKGSYRRRYAEANPPFEVFAERFLQIADKQPDSAVALQAIVWVLNAGDPDGLGMTKPVPRSKKADKLLAKAVQLLERDHLQRPEFGDVCQILSAAPLPECDELLRAALAKHAQADVRGLAGYALALSLAFQSDTVRPRDPAKADALALQAEKQLDVVYNNFKGVAYGRSTLGDVAKDKLFELRFLSIGKVAPEIEGEDLDGKRFKLSDYRGKVVVVDFWANWCGWCRQMYPLEKRLVDNYKDRPFALVGVNTDQDRAKIKRTVAKEGINWRSWWDGDRGPIADKWQVNSFPTVYILDGDGVIRHKNVSARDLEQHVLRLVNVQEAKMRAGSK